ncbi:uncharacterized protein LOC141575752 [Camelus bactrianus]|uniref:Uncharacterized protein LOC141575752 n=1 Tax=Camelus bactrianus TaxID=9837 RepID=A0AC58PPT0_CAMBA
MAAKLAFATWEWQLVHANQREVLFAGKEQGNVWKRRGTRALFLGTLEARARAAPATASKIAQALAQRLPVVPNDASPQPRAGLGRRICRSSPFCHWAPLSHHNHRRPLFLRLLGDPPTSSQPMKKEVDKRPPYGGRRRPFPAVKRSYSLENSRQGWGMGQDREVSKSAGNIRALGAVELRRAVCLNFLGLAAMLKCGMSGSQVKGGVAFLALMCREEKANSSWGSLHHRLIS